MLSDLPDYDDHEMVAFLRDKESGLRAVIAIHDTRLGPAHGGTRAWHYGSEAAAATDALRLSRGMTLKNAVAGLPLGGGKSVILLEAGGRATPAMLRAFGRAVDTLGGRYIPAEDVGIGPDDMAEIAAETRHALGVPGPEGAAGADPSPYTALGIFHAMGAALGFATGDASVRGRHVAVQGLGGVGRNLCEYLAEAGARLTVADIDAGRVAAAARSLDAETADPDAIHRVAADVFAPCALGGVLNARTIPELGAGIVCGGANNQLADARAGEALLGRGILYAPDFVVNAGGVIHAALAWQGRPTEEIEARVLRIGETVRTILREASRRGALPEQVALDRARAILAAA